MPTGTIRDPIHNQEQCRYGIVWVRQGDGILAVYDKNDFETLKHLPAGWKIMGNLTDVNPPFLWCGIEITRRLRVTNTNAGGHGPISDYEEPHLRGHPHFDRPWRDPGTGGVLYPED